MERSSIYLVRKPSANPYVPNSVAMSTRVARGKIRLAAFDGPFPKPTIDAKILQISLTQTVL